MNNQKNDKWQDYWNSDEVEKLETPYWTEFYVDAISALDVIGAEATVLDFGAGWGAIGASLGAHCRRLILLDASEKLRHLMARRFEDDSGTLVVASLEEVNESIDVILANSVFQYIPLHEGVRILESFSLISRPGTILLMSDLVPIKYSKVEDLIFLLAHTFRVGRLPTFISHVWRAVRQSGDTNLADRLERYESGFILRVLDQLGFDAKVLPRNLTPSSRRYSVLAVKRADRSIQEEL